MPLVQLNRARNTAAAITTAHLFRWVSGLKDVLDETPSGSDTRRIRFSAGTMGLSVSYTLEYTLESPTRLSWVSVAGWVHTVHDWDWECRTR